MKKKIIAAGLAAAIILTAVFFIYPRSLKHIFTGNAIDVEITLHELFSEQPAKKLSAEEEELLLSAMANTQVRRKLFPKKQFHPLHVYNISIFIRESDGKTRWVTAEYYSDEEGILSFGKGKGQYKFYHNDFIEALLSLMNAEQ